MAEYIDKHEAYKMLKDLEAAYMQVAVKEAYGTAARHIDQMRAADVQPVKRGKWVNECIEDDMNVWWAGCSACGEDVHSRYGRVSVYNYCPNCGAKMVNENDP